MLSIPNDGVPSLYAQLYFSQVIVSSMRFLIVNVMYQWNSLNIC